MHQCQNCKHTAEEDAFCIVHSEAAFNQPEDVEWYCHACNTNGPIIKVFECVMCTEFAEVFEDVCQPCIQQIFDTKTIAGCEAEPHEVEFWKGLLK